MNGKQRQRMLVYAACGVGGLFLLDSLVITPAARNWSEQGERIDALQKKVDRGDKLVERERTIRERWAGMTRANLPPDNSVAGDLAYRAFGRWAQESKVVVNAVSPAPQWQNHDEGYETIEWRATIAGDQAALGKFIYNLEVDPLPVNLEECEIATRDARGSQLTMTARFTFARLTTAAGSGAGGANTNSGGKAK